MTEQTKNIIDTLLEIPLEDIRIELKRLGADFKVSKVIESIVAMANTDGGFLILGVDDPEKTKAKGLDRIFGIEECPEKYDEIAREIQRIVPPLSYVWPPQLEKANNGKTVAIIAVPKAIGGFHSIDNSVFVRLSKGNKRLTPHEIPKLSYAKGFDRADRELVDVDFDALRTEYFKKWKDHTGIEGDDIKEILFHRGLARKDESGILLPVRAAVLLFALHPHLLLDTKCAIRVFQYEGTIETISETLNLIGAPKTIEGPIMKVISDAHEYVLMVLRAGMRIPSSGFVTTYRVPERAVKEAITNAVVHRDYYLKRDIEIKIFEDRIEIDSPGLFAYNITSYNIGFVRAEGYRNDLLVKHLREFPNPPNLDRNEGVRAMRSEMDAHNLYPPVFLSYPHFNDSVRVFLFNAIRASEWDKVYAYLQNKEKYVANEKVRNIINNPDTSKVSRLLRKWVAQGLLVKVDSGAKKSVKYRLPIDASKGDLFAAINTNKS